MAFPSDAKTGVVPASRIQVVTQVTYNLLTWHPNYDQAKTKVFMVGDARQSIFFKRAKMACCSDGWLPLTNRK